MTGGYATAPLTILLDPRPRSPYNSLPDEKAVPNGGWLAARLIRQLFWSNFPMNATLTRFVHREDILRSWYVVDANEQTLGRLSTRIAKVLTGKHRADYTPNADNGDFHALTPVCSRPR